MQYRTAGATGAELSLMGFGCMRFSRRGIATDQAKAERELTAALDAGVNYFDTAYTYPGSEEALGAWLAKGNRERVFVATKLPHYQCKGTADFDRIFEEQLKRLHTDHIDFYLMHMLTSLTSWQRIVDLGIVEWIAKRKAAGQIRHIGFSFHGSRDDFKRIVDAYDWEFCQIQLNYLDAHAQAGLDGLHYAAAAGFPVIIMEPLRGGHLATQLPPAAQSVFRQADPSLTSADWGLQWLFDLPEVTCVLSGMNSLDQVKANCALADRVGANSLSDETKAVYERAIAQIKRTEKVSCTGCGYCMPCPHGVDIPTCFRCYNMRSAEGYLTGMKEYIMCTSMKAQPSNAGRCIGCGLCLKKCPQGIQIPDVMKQVQDSLEGLPYRIAVKASGTRFKVD